MKVLGEVCLDQTIASLQRSFPSHRILTVCPYPMTLWQKFDGLLMSLIVPAVHNFWPASLVRPMAGCYPARKHQKRGIWNDTPPVIHLHLTWLLYMFSEVTWFQTGTPLITNWQLSLLNTHLQLESWIAEYIQWHISSEICKTFKNVRTAKKLIAKQKKKKKQQ